MSDELLQVARMGSVLTLTMNRASSANALSADLVEALIHELESLNPADIRLCVIKGNGKHFCACANRIIRDCKCRYTRKRHCGDCSYRRPGLKDRVMAYQNVVAEKRSKNKLGSGAS